MLIIEKLSDDKRGQCRLSSLLTVLDVDYVPPLNAIVDIPKYVERLLKNAEVLVAVLDESDIGLIAVYANDIDTRTAFISSIGVMPAARGKGVGERLIDAAVKLCMQTGMKRLRLEVSIQNAPAAKLYRRCGFRLLSEIFPNASYEHSLFYEKKI